MDVGLYNRDAKSRPTLPSFALILLKRERHFRHAYHLSNRNLEAFLGSVPSHILATTGWPVRDWNHRPQLDGRMPPRAGGCITVATHDKLNTCERPYLPFESRPRI